MSDVKKGKKVYPKTDYAWVANVVHDLVCKEKRVSAFEILDMYYEHAETTRDYDILGEISIEAEHRELYEKCALSAYALCETTEQLKAGRANLYKVYNLLNQPEKALFYINIGLELEPDDFELLMAKSFNLSLMGKRKEGEKIIRSFINNERKCTEEEAENLTYALSGDMLRKGQTSEGILNFIDTFKPKSQLFDDWYKMEKWVGQPFEKGRTIYINGEGGIGDEFINIRFLDHLKELGLRPILYSSWSMYRPDTVDIFRRHGYEVISEYHSIRPDALWTNMMPLPAYLGLSEDELWRGPYLKPLRQEKNKLTSDKFKIGIKCNGNPYFSQDVYRSIPIDMFKEYLPKDAEIYYLDKDKEYEGTINMGPRIETWDDTFDFIDQMDVIVSSCTSLVHAAGAIGKQSIVIVPIAEYYVWTSTRTNDSTPWYGDNFTVLKQTELRDWHGPFKKAQKLIKDMMDGV
jgi:hypothetical protein